MNHRETPQRSINMFLAAALLGPPLLLAGAHRALAWDARDIVFECPCSAEWVADAGGQGTLHLNFGVRSHRATESGHIHLGFYTGIDSDNDQGYGNAAVGRVSAGEHLNGLQLIAPVRRPRPAGESLVEIRLYESATAGGAEDSFHEWLTLWPVPDPAESGRIRYVDILTDTDGDGVGDVNEGIAGTDPADPASTPGESTVDVLWLYDDGAPHGTRYAQVHHFKAVSNAVLADSGTNMRLRTAGIARIEKTDDDEWPDREHLRQLMDRHGADVTHQVGHSLRPCPSGCARTIGGGLRRGLWAYTDSFAVPSTGALTVIHELGHVMGLAHSVEQGEAHGAFRWSRGHFLNRWEARYEDRSQQPRSQGTIMSYGEWGSRPVFSDPAADCNGEPCGVPATEADGADARKSLDLVRFQIAAQRGAKPDSDGDGFVDDADAAPGDPVEWIDNDADGIGDNADPDDDNDGVDDARDRWPLDPREWEDLDNDGIGDNADTFVDIEGTLEPFRDAGLRRAVESALGKSPGESISAEEMAGLQSLAARSMGIRDLTGLELATGLTDLYLDRNSVTDLTPIAGLAKLEGLWLFWNQVADLSPLSRMAGLRRLSLEWNVVADLSPLAELEQLESLWLGRNGIDDLSPLAGLEQLGSLWLNRNGIDDLSPLAGLESLRFLSVSDNRVADLSPLAGMSGLRDLVLSWNLITDVSLLSGLTGLRSLALEGNDISDVTPLSGLQDLRRLLLTRNRIADFSPIQSLTRLETLGLGSNHLSDLSHLSGLTRLRELRLDVNRVTDLSPLAGLSELRQLWLGSNELSDLSPIAGLELVDLDVGRTGVTLDDVVALPGLRSIRSLGIAGLGITDVSPLAALTELRRLSLDNNAIADISPLAVREIWANDRSELHLHDNPLDEASVDEHLPLLESWGVSIGHEKSPAVSIPDKHLHWHVAQQSAYNQYRADVRSLSRKRMEGLYRLAAFNAGVSDLTGLEWAVNLWSANLGSNSVSDVSPLSKLDNLANLDLRENLVSDISPLVDMDALQMVDLSGNPLTEEALNDHILRLRGNGVKVEVESVEWKIPAGTETATFEVDWYFRSLLGSVWRFEAVGDDPGLAAVRMNGSVLEVSPQGESGVLTATVTASGGAGTSGSLLFRIAVAEPADDHGDEPGTATDLALGVAVQGHIEPGDDEDHFRLKLGNSASVAVYTTGDLDTLGTLSDESGEPIASDDDGGRSFNFHIEADLPAGVYYVRVASYGSETGPYTLHARRFADVALGDTGETVRLWGTADGGWTLDSRTDVSFASGQEVTASNGDAYLLTLGSGAMWTASPKPGLCLTVPDATIGTLAGTGVAGFGGDGGFAADAQLNGPFDVAVDAAGYVYVADRVNHRIRRIGPDGIIETFAGTGVAGYGGDGGPVRRPGGALLNSPIGVAVDAAGYVYIADHANHRIRRIATDGTIETFAGMGVAGYSGDGGPATEAQLDHPTSVAVDTAGNVYVADSENHSIRRIGAGGAIETIAGTGVAGYGGDGGPATGARLNFPFGVAVGADGRVYVADTGNNRVRRIDTDGTIETFAGTGESGFGGDDGAATAARLDQPAGLAVDAAGNVYVADWGNHRVRWLGTGGTIGTFAGTGESGFGGDGFGGDGGPASQARLFNPSGVAVDPAGQVYIADTGNNRVRSLSVADECP